ncbi:unnamed protein product, partial [Strongylus vulgaris]
VSWSRVYLGVHSPCDVLGGWTIGVLLLFIFGGFSDKLYDAYESSSSSDLSFFVYFYSVVLFLIWAHPRAWPETQSYGELGIDFALPSSNTSLNFFCQHSEEVCKNNEEMRFIVRD